MIKLHSFFIYLALLSASWFVSIQGFSLDKTQTERRDKKNINLEFTAADFLYCELGPEQNHTELTTKKEADKLDTFKVPYVSDKFPNGPVGAKSYTKPI